ncbi:major facilitator superfamily domain-containing protein [Armillaria mellea]|nr:major facilitator superfamily domain-containing protein [Armillaria mellea]
MVQDIFRDSTLGQAINYISSGRFFPYADQRPDFAVPSHFILPPSQRPSTIVSPDSDATTLCGDVEKTGVQLTRRVNAGSLNSDPYIVGWYGDDDQENPRNWSPAKRAFVAFSISFLTFSVYIGSAIYTPSIPGLMADFNVSQTTATLGLSLYVLAYGIGPMFLAPLQELPGIGRNPVYMVTLFLFVIFQKHEHWFSAFRFLTGFVGSPALATGGASMADIYPMHQFAYVLGIWALGAVAGPITGPVIGGFAAQANGWRWPQRAQRLRKLTGNQELRSQGEKDKEGSSLGAVMQEALIRTIHSCQGACFDDIYHFNLGLSGLAFLAFVVSGAITVNMPKAAAAGIDVAPEIRLEIGLIASIFIPTSVLMFGFTSKESIHWIVPVIGAALYLPGIYLTFQSILTYITSAYPTYAASVLAGNDLFRSSIASVFHSLDVRSL